MRSGMETRCDRDSGASVDGLHLLGDERVNVLVVDDIRLSRDTLTAALAGETFVAEVAGARDAADAVRQLERHGFDVVLLSLTTPGSVAFCRDRVAAAPAAH